MNRFAKIVFSSLITMSIISCATSVSDVADDNFQAAKGVLRNKADQHTNISKSPVKVKVSDGVSVVGKAFNLSDKPKYPSMFNENYPFTVKEKMTVIDIYSRISQDSGYSILLRPDAREFLYSVKKETVQQGDSQGDSANAALDSIVTTSQILPKMAVVDFSGSFKSLLDHVSTYNGLYWEWRKNRVEVYRHKTKSFFLDSQAHESSVSSKVSSTSASSSSGEAGGTTGSNMQTSAHGNFNLWGSVKEMLDQIKSEDGKISYNNFIGKVTVTDVPPVVDRIEAVLEDVNDMARQMVFLKVEVYQVESNGSSDFGIDWNAVLNDGASDIVLDTANAFTNGVAQGVSSIIDPSENYTGSQILVRALEKQGKVSRVNQFNVNAMNGASAPIQDVFETAYVKRSSTTVTQETVSSEIEDAVVSSGITMNIRPQITSRGEVSLFSIFNMTSLQEIVDFSSPTGDITVQLPQKKVRQLHNISRAKSGSTVLITGFKQSNSDKSKEGLGSASTWFLGGSKKGSYGSSELVILITPYIIG